MASILSNSEGWGPTKVAYINMYFFKISICWQTNLKMTVTAEEAVNNVSSS